MGPMTAGTAARTIRASRRRRGRKVLCESLETRQLLSLTIEVRDAGGGTSTTVTSVGQVVNLEVLAVITDSAHMPTLDGVQDVNGDFISTAVDGHAVAGNLAAANIAPFKASGAAPGTQQDLNGDGNIDVGINFSAASTAGLFFARSSPVQTGEDNTGNISGGALTFKIGTLTYTVTSLNEGGSTSINFVPYTPPTEGGTQVPDAASWLEDGAQKDNADGTFQAATAYTVSDPTIIPAPTAVNDTVTVTKNTPTIINELANDNAVQTLNPASVTIVTPPTHGTTQLQSSGSIQYTPTNDYTGPDQFTYTVADTSGRMSNAATVNITVVNAPPPVAVADTASTVEDQPVTISVLANDTVTAPATLNTGSVAIVSASSHGTAVAQSNGTVIYTPAANYLGTDTFTYTVMDSNGEISPVGTVTVTINAPVAPTVPASTPETTTAGAPLTIDVLSLATLGTSALAPSSVTVVSQPTNGTAVAQADGSILYTPTGAFTGTDSFTYTVADTTGLKSGLGTILMTVNPATPPVATPVTTTGLTGQGNTINVLANASSGSPIVPGSVEVVTQPADGSATVNTSTGLITYTPEAGFIGTDTFTYTVGNAALLTSNTATVSVNVGTSISSAKGQVHTLSFNDAAGGLETLSLSVGTAAITFTGNGSLTTAGSKATVTGMSLNLGTITLTGTTKASAFTVRGTAGHNATTTGIIDATPLGSLNAPTLSVTEDNNGGVISDGEAVKLDSAGTLILGNLTDASITVGAALPGHLAFTAASVTGTSLTSAAPIASLKAASWTTTSGDTITAPSITSLNVAGAFQPNLTLTSAGKAPALSSAKITGAVSGGTWNVSGSINSIATGSITSAWTGTLHNVNSFAVKSGGLSANFSAVVIGTLSIVGNVTGNISATSAKLIRVTGTVTGSTFGIDGNLGRLAISGGFINSAVVASGNIAGVSAGSVSGSNIQAGQPVMLPDVGTIVFNQISTANIGSGTLGRLKTGSFASSVVEAAKIGPVSLGTVTTDNSGTTFGIATTRLGGFTGVFSSGTVRIPHADLGTQELLTAYINQQVPSLQDFSIAILT